MISLGRSDAETETVSTSFGVGVYAAVEAGIPKFLRGVLLPGLS